jgi:hypothetical protein
MKTFTINSIAILAIGAAVLAANTASAGGFGFGGGGGGGNGGGGGGGFKFSIGGGNHNNNHNNHAHHDHHHKYYHHKYYHHTPVKRYYVQPALVYDRCYHPRYRYCIVYPGDTWLSICQRTYGCTYLWKHIATYNHMPLSMPLVAGQQLYLPVVNANGTLAASNAPAPPALAAPTQPVAAPTQPAAPPNTSDEAALPSVAVGSAMKFSGESLGNEKGTVRLLIGELALPVEVSEWNVDSAKIQLPKLDLTAPMKAELEVMRADGSVVSKSSIKLTPADSRLALGN